ncbi:hypothetical protein M9458_017704, partial [Cirrhinus mrigala]
MVCLGVGHTESAIEGAFTSIPSRVWSRFCRGGVAAALVEFLFPYPPDPLPVLWDQKPLSGFFPMGNGLDTLSVFLRGVAKLNIDWPGKKQAEPQKSKLDERFLHTKPPPPRRSLPSFPDLLTDVSRSWGRPFFACLFILASDYYSNVVGLGWLRAALTQEERSTLHSLVPLADQSANPAGAPASSCLQRALTSVSSARKLIGAEELATPAGVSKAGSLAISCRSSVTGHRTSSSNNTRGHSRETGSLSRLCGSVKTTIYYCQMYLLWVVHTVERGLVMEQEEDTVLRKEAIEVVPPHHRESGFYSQYFILPKKDGGLRPILDLRQLNHSVMRLKSKMLTVKQVVSQI